MKRGPLLELLNWLLRNTDLQGSRDVLVAEKLLIFLFICSHAIKFRVVAETFQHSARTIHRAFYEVHGLLLHQEIIALPPDKTPDEIEQDDKYWPYFADCIGALDGTHIEAWVPGRNQSCWRNRKGHL
jgi:hypothetical protein